ncbi:bifunctional precorrin-2 dehydrogenase/sirohydrochlorin ferrochelatase [Ferrimonas sediminicola]|uniref:precorrin-2 dehydrogenase n=1 Tax=Ferrimonas sediminicola TaxID=2569538 RepID=A0A4U1BHC7_9GAMM|nr:bifunctional precorrin-2 dehydrogenase/sirohydrochlorin ferrochelatase [Ferrimonas sediminicola]TKB49421.1 bifunctional precorrin-2 dehydrogenase/sirohydrochlorin ferrochelatase [Ferrimonas sediminicola]
MRYFPLFFDTRNRRLLIVGGGEVAARKLALWRRSEMSITLVSPSLNEELSGRRAEFTWLPGEFHDDLIEGMDGVIAATDDEALNRRVADLARAAGAWVNVVDDPDSCSVITPAIVDRTPMVVAIGSEGAAPVLVKELRRRIESLLPASLGHLARFMGRARYKVPLQERRRVWERFLASNGLQWDPVRSESRFEQACRGGVAESWVLMVSPDVEVSRLPLGALQLMQECDALWHQGVLPPALDELCRRDASRLAIAGALPEVRGKVMLVADADQQLALAGQLQGGRVIRIELGRLSG